jgi:hypothetical protein
VDNSNSESDSIRNDDFGSDDGSDIDDESYDDDEDQFSNKGF